MSSELGRFSVFLMNELCVDLEGKLLTPPKDLYVSSQRLTG